MSKDKLKAIKLDHGFDVLQDSLDKDIKYNFYIDFDIKSVLKNELTRIEANFYLEPKKKDPDPIDNKIFTNDFVYGMLVGNKSVKKSKKTRDYSKIASTHFDISKSIDNSVAAKFKSGIKEITKKKISLVKKGDINIDDNFSIAVGSSGKPLPKSKNNGSFKLNSKKLISKFGKDPASAYRIAPKTFSTRTVLRGTFNKTFKFDKHQPASIKVMAGIIPSRVGITKTFNIGNLSSKTYFPVLRKRVIKWQELKGEISIPSKKLKGKGVFYIELNVLDKGGEIVQSITRKVNHIANLKNLQPKIPPSIYIYSVPGAGKNHISISQNDKKGLEIRVQRKQIGLGHNLKDQKYVDIGDFKLKYGESPLKFIDPISNEKTTIYRVFSIGKFGVTDEFNSETVPAKSIKGRNNKEKGNQASIEVTTGQKGFFIKVKVQEELPIAVKLVRRNLTLFEKTLTTPNISTPIRNNSGQQKHTFTDSTVVEDHIYEYACVLIYEDGTEEFSTGSDVEEFEPLNDDVAEVLVTNLKIKSDNVTFNLRSIIRNTSVDDIKKMLERQGLIQYFGEDILKDRDKLQSLLAHSITRKNITTGEKENFGTITKENFDTKKMQKISGVKPLQEGHIYKYEIKTLARQPETIIPSFEKTIESKNGNKYIFSPLKFMSPLNLKKGILSPNGVTRTKSKDSFALGSLGNRHEFIVSIPKNISTIEDFKISNLNKENVQISFKVNGDIEEFDHFVLMSEDVTGVNIVKVIHNNFSNGEVVVLDNKKDNKVGSLKYRLIPVFLNYEKGTEMVSNEIVV